MNTTPKKKRNRPRARTRFVEQITLFALIVSLTTGLVYADLLRLVLHDALRNVPIVYYASTSRVPIYDYGEYVRVAGIPFKIWKAHAVDTFIFITTTGASQFTLPADWSDTNTIHVIGGGGGAEGGICTTFECPGGGGGAYAFVSNLSGLSSPVDVNVGIGGNGGSAGESTAGGNTWFNATSCALSSVCAGGGGRGIRGGSAGAGGTVQVGAGNSGGAGANPNVEDVGGGGGAGGPNNPGTGGIEDDGGAGDGGSANGGTGGTGGKPCTAGGNGTEWVQTSDSANAGSGGGGGAGNGNGNVNGCAAGLYGGGGAAGTGSQGVGSAGAQGVIVVQYTPVETKPASLSQHAYRWFANTDSVAVGGTTGLNSPTLAPSQGTPFRLRMLIYNEGGDLGSSGTTTDLQVALSDGLCSGNESYADVSPSSGAIRYFNNATPADGDNLTANSFDPRATSTAVTVRNQDYEEANTFTNSVAAITENEAGLWDFALIDFSAPPETTYCFRAVQGGVANDLLSGGYDVFPEITTAKTVTIRIRGTVRLRTVRLR